MNPEQQAKKLLEEANLICQEAEIKAILNKDIAVCCPNCHKVDYEIFPTGQMGNVIRRPEEDLHWVCRLCGYVWNSEFLGVRYNYQKSNYTGWFHPRYKKYKPLWYKILVWIGWAT